MNELETSAEGNVDRIVLEEFFNRAGRGVFIDVGAARPDYLSISALYRAFGWRVIAIEPNPEFCEIHRARGHEVLQYACGDHDEDNVDFTIVDSHGCDYRGGCVSFESFSSLGIKDSYATLQADLDTREIKVNLRASRHDTPHARRGRSKNRRSFDRRRGMGTGGPERPQLPQV
jgi:FkbM family methyltransferase